MRRWFRPPMFLIVVALIAVMTVLATLQYKWLGRISDAERESRRSTLAARATAFAADFDKELTLAYVLFQVEPVLDSSSSEDGLASRLAVRYERWQATSRFPRLIRSCFIASGERDGAPHLRRFDPATKSVQAADWPAELADLRAQIALDEESSTIDATQGRTTGTFVVRRMPGPLWDEVPALLVPMPVMLFDAVRGRSPARVGAHLSHTVLVLNREYISRELLPALAEQHLRGLGDGVDYEVAVVSAAGRGAVYRSAAGFDPGPEANVDAVASLFQVRPQEFPQIAADVRRFSLSVTRPPVSRASPSPNTRSAGAGDRPVSGTHGYFVRRGEPLSVLLDQTETTGKRSVVTSIATGLPARSADGTPKWRLLVKHPSGSLEAAVGSARRRNMLVSSSILAVLGASMALLVLSARRAHEVARQQMEFVAAVSHELRTPLAVIRSAGDNLADGVVGDVAHIKKYGELVRSEGRRLSEMVEQILDFAGIQSGQRRLEPRPVAVAPLLQEVLSASTALIEAAHMQVETEIQPDLPPVLGDEPALRRVVQNLVGNAIKYGGEGRWIGLRARQVDREVRITVADRGLGIAPAEQARIFEPFYRATEVIAAQIQGAGLGLSLVQRIVDAHGGHVTVKSAAGAGSEFTVHLPAADPELVPGADPRTAEAPRFT